MLSSRYLPNCKKNHHQIYFLLIPLSVVLFLIVGSVSLYAAETIRVGIFDFEPLCQTPSSMQSGGLFIELLENIAAKEKWQIHYIPGTLPECMQRLEQGEIDILPAATYSQENRERYYFTRQTIISTWAQVYSLEREQNNLQSLLQMDKYTVGVVRDDPYNQELRRIIKAFDIKVTFVEFSSSYEVFEAIKKKWIDAGVVDRLYGVRHAASMGVKQTPIIFSPVELRFATSKEGHRNLIDTLDYHLTRLKNNPNSPYYQLVDRILGEKENTRIPPIVFWSLGAAVRLLLLFVSASF